ncbi:MAG: sugar transferase, partial [Paracoccaceae bacterium]|nr:sugar transferase [Paracoccaceae bacterium]
MQALLARPWLISGLYAGGGKRLFDLALVILFVPLWLPLVGVAWLISWQEAGQGFYSDLRVGQNGVQFRCWKIRT